ncbi:hypothetical protein VB773_19765 [Haloarculaceae archaeon H-GB2-1]|nr:hypothetical protein [Haloarculaceae archaeon H-GB1-1]MEA5409592.1 hypothetical protein [Haloarculaceae archaeon H-GB2-1]
MTRKLRREDAWKVVFVIINLVALGLTSWVIDSASAWGFGLDGLELVLASMLAGSLVVIGILGASLYSEKRDNGRDVDPGQSGEDTEKAGISSRAVSDRKERKDAGEQQENPGRQSRESGQTSPFATEALGYTASSAENTSSAAEAGSQQRTKHEDETGREASRSPLERTTTNDEEEKVAKAEGSEPNVEDSLTDVATERESGKHDESGTDGDKIDQDLLIGDQFDDSEQRDSDSDGTDEDEKDEAPIDEHTVRYRHNRSPY